MITKPKQNDINTYMSEAIKLAKKAYDLNEVPVGCIIVKNGTIINQTHNTTKAEKLAINHAELIAIKNASDILKKEFLTDCDIYVTMEPCPMCAYAIRLSKIRRVYFGCYDYKNGALGGQTNIIKDGFGHKPEVYGGIKEQECANLLTSFFKSKRK